MSESVKNKLIANGLELSKFFEIEFTIKVFGRVLLHFTYPPKKQLL